MKIAFFASSLVSAYRNGAATYYRGIVRALADRGHRITFYEPDASDRQRHRDMDDPAWAAVIVYPPTPDAARRMVDHARGADLVVKASGVGINDELLDQAVLELRSPQTLVAWWDVDAPATLRRLNTAADDPLRASIPRYDIVFTSRGGPPAIAAYEALGAAACVPIYSALDPSTHHPVGPDPRFAGALGFLGNRLPDRERRVEDLFLGVATRLPHVQFLLGGAGWADKSMPSNVKYVGHVYTRDHNAFNVTPVAVLDLNREATVQLGHSPSTRMFEAAGAGACVITDAWAGIERFLEPGREVLVANDGAEVARALVSLTPLRASSLGEHARARLLREHTYAHRALEIEAALGERVTPRRRAKSLSFAILGLSITSSWSNGHATTYRSVLRALAARGHRITFLERDMPWYAEHRDLTGGEIETGLYKNVAELRERFGQIVRDADVVVVGSSVPDGVAIGRWVLDTARGFTAFYDMDTPATVAQLAAGTCEYLSPDLVRRYRLYLSFTGGPALRAIEREHGAPRARPLYPSVDPEVYAPEPQERRWDLGYMGAYSDDCQPAVQRLLVEPARSEPARRFVVVGRQYPTAIEWPANVERIEHLAPDAHRAFYNQSAFALDVAQRSPSVRLFEAAACGVPIISDHWAGLDELFDPGREILLADRTEDVCRYLRDLGDTERSDLGARGRARVIDAHTSAHRAIELERYVREDG